MKNVNTFTLRNTDDKTPPRPMFANVPKVGKPHRLYAPQQGLHINYQATGPPNPKTYANNITDPQTNTVNASNHVDTYPQTYANNHVNTNQQPNANNTTNAQHPPHQQRNWNCSINSFQHTVSTQKTPVYYMPRHQRHRSCYYSTFTNSTGSKTVNTNNISITSNWRCLFYWIFLI